MAAVLAEHRPREPRSEQNTPAAFVLALAMHALLVAALWISVQWRTETAGAVVVELWGAAPPAEPVAIVPPPPPPPVRVEPQPERPDADIAVREEKKKEPKVEPQPDARRLEADRRKAEADKQRQEAEARKREAEKRQAELERKKQAEAAAQAAEQKREEQRRESVRKAEEARVLAQAGTGSGGGSPAAAAAGGAGRGDAGYAGIIAAHIKPRIVFAVPDGTSKSVFARYRIELLPTGEILRVQLLRPSGLPGYDEAVERAIRRSDPLPRKADGTVERSMEIDFYPVERP